MEYQFENIQHYNRKICLEFYYKIFCRAVLIWGMLMVLLMMILTGVALQQSPRGWIGVPAAVGLAVYYFTWPYRLEGMHRKRAELKYGKDQPGYVRFGDKIYTDGSSGTTTLEYDDIEKVVVLKHGMFLRYEKKNYLGIDPNGFTSGTYEEFKQFLREKCPKLNIPD